MKKVAVLMSTYNGERYIEQQLESLSSQVGLEIDILVRDDGSKDNTLSILRAWELKNKLIWYKGENLGPALSFMDLIRNAPQADFYAFCDQDDYWDEDKLKIAVEAIKGFGEDSPSLYFSNKRLVDENLCFIENTKQEPRITFGSALIINPVTGCTLVMNRKLLEIVRTYENRNLYMHDGWVYRVCMALNGNVYFDRTPHISYRQHRDNVIGGKSSIIKRYKRRFNNVIVDRKRIRERDACEIMKGYAHIISSDNLDLLKKIVCYRDSFSQKIKLILDSRFRTNCFEHDLSFVLAVLFDAF